MTRIYAALVVAILAFGGVNTSFAQPPTGVGAIGGLDQKLDELLVLVEDTRAEVDQLNDTVERGLRVFTASTVVTTFAGQVTPFNPETLVPSPFTPGQIMRFTLAIHANLGVLTPEPSVRVVTRVPDGTGTSYEVEVIDLDASELKPSPSPGITVGPYVGVSSTVQFVRGADGQGPIDVLIATYIEREAHKSNVP